MGNNIKSGAKNRSNSDKKSGRGNSRKDFRLDRKRSIADDTRNDKRLGKRKIGKMDPMEMKGYLKGLAEWVEDLQISLKRGA